MEIIKLLDDLRAVPASEHMEILELLSRIAEDQTINIPGYTSKGGVRPNPARVTQLNAILQGKGFESTLDESRRTGVPFPACEKKYQGTEFLIRHAMTSLEVSCVTPSMFGALVRKKAQEQGYAPRHGTWG